MENFFFELMDALLPATPSLVPIFWGTHFLFLGFFLFLVALDVSRRSPIPNTNAKKADKLLWRFCILHSTVSFTWIARPFIDTPWIMAACMVLFLPITVGVMPLPPFSSVTSDFDFTLSVWLIFGSIFSLYLTSLITMLVISALNDWSSIARGELFVPRLPQVLKERWLYYGSYGHWSVTLYLIFNRIYFFESVVFSTLHPDLFAESVMSTAGAWYFTHFIVENQVALFRSVGIL